jgi:hypothetical protein
MFAARVLRRDISKLTLIVIPHLAVIFNERGRLKMEGTAKSDHKKTGDITYLTCWFIKGVEKYQLKVSFQLSQDAKASFFPLLISTVS